MIKKKLSLILHVGDGLDDHSKFNCDPTFQAVHCPELLYPEQTREAAETLAASLIAARERLSRKTRAIDVTLSTQAIATCITPEILKSEQAALESLLRLLRDCIAAQVTLSVTTLSEGITGPLLNAVYDLDLCAATVVVLHHSASSGLEARHCVHTLAEDGALEDWPYGVLIPSVDTGDLVRLGFPEAADIALKRGQLRQLQTQLEVAGHA